MNRPGNVLDASAPPGLHFGAAAAALKDTVESATAALLLFFSPFQNSTAIITVGPARPTPGEGFCVYVCRYKDRGLEFETLFFFFGEVWLAKQSFYHSLTFRCSLRGMHLCWVDREGRRASL